MKVAYEANEMKKQVHVLDTSGKMVYTRLFDDGSDVLVFESGFGHVTRDSITRNFWTVSEGWPLTSANSHADLQRGRGEKMRKPTIYEALKKKLGREPYNNELQADVRRILREGREEREGKCGTRKSLRRKKKKTFGSSVTATGIRS